MVVAKDKRPVNGQFVPRHVGQSFRRSASHQIKRLIHLFQAVSVQRFETDQHSLTPTATHQVQSVFVVTHIDR